MCLCIQGTYYYTNICKIYLLPTRITTWKDDFVYVFRGFGLAVVQLYSVKNLRSALDNALQEHVVT